MLDAVSVLLRSPMFSAGHNLLFASRNGSHVSASGVAAAPPSHREPDLHHNI
jgi:hypothetical protein